jgi:hypothetical protein
MKKDRYYLLRKNIDRQCFSFDLYLSTFFPLGIIRLMDELAKQSHVYIFSGVIKNFLLGFLEHRDLDLVVSHKHKLSFHIGKLLGLGLSEIKRNKFNGVKLVLDNMEVDIWRIEDTMGIVDMRLFPTPENLLKTCFFNFSSIVYDYNNSRFIYGEDFCKFLLTRELDVIYEKNPFVESCIVSTFYYAEKYELSVSKKLCDWIRFHYEEGMDFQKVQQKRFGTCFLSNLIISKIIKLLDENPNTRLLKLERIRRNLVLDLEGKMYNVIYSVNL